MHIAVYCGSVCGKSKTHSVVAEAIGRLIGLRGHSMVYGGSDTGLMGISANAALQNGAEVIGVLPDVELIHEREHKALTRYIYTETMHERKDEMIRLSDAYIALPGGYGTLDEISDVLCLSRIGLLPKPIVLVNSEGFYDELKALFVKMEKMGYVGGEEMRNVLFSDDPEEIMNFIENSAR